MMKNIIFPTALLFMLFFIWQCNGCKDPNCGSGYVSDDNTCKCPEGRFEAHGICKKLNTNEYYAISEGCDCRDSAFFVVGEKQFDPATGQTILKIGRSWGASGNDEYYVNELSFYYQDEPDGYSLTGHVQIPGCPRNGDPSFATFAGSYREGSDTITILQFNGSLSFDDPTRDTCIWRLHK